MTGPAPDDARLRLAPVPDSVGAARRFARRALGGWRRDDLEDTVTLLVSELVTNVVLHAGTPAELVLRREDGRVRAEVHDRDGRAPQRKRYGLESTTGRGLALVSALADDWGVTVVEDGKVVWFEVRAGADDGTSGRPGGAP